MYGFYDILRCQTSLIELKTANKRLSILHGECLVTLHIWLLSSVWSRLNRLYCLYVFEKLNGFGEILDSEMFESFYNIFFGGAREYFLRSFICIHEILVLVNYKHTLRHHWYDIMVEMFEILWFCLISWDIFYALNRFDISLKWIYAYKDTHHHSTHP